MKDFGIKEKVADTYRKSRNSLYKKAGVKDTETGEIDERRRRLVQGLSGIAVIGGAGIGTDIYADGVLDGNFGEWDILEPNNANTAPATTRTATQTPSTEPTKTPTETATPTDSPTPTASPEPTDSPTQTPTTTYSGEIDGSDYQLQAVPGPVEGQGFNVEDDLLASYDPDAWMDIKDEEEYEALGTGTDWYVKREALIGVNIDEKISRTFPAEEFNYNTEELYEDIREEA